VEVIRSALRKALPELIGALLAALVTGIVAYFWVTGGFWPAFAVGVIAFLIILGLTLCMGRGREGEAVGELPPSAPCQAPRPLAEFVGRRDQIRCQALRHS